MYVGEVVMKGKSGGVCVVYWNLLKGLINLSMDVEGFEGGMWESMKIVVIWWVLMEGWRSVVGLIV